MPYFADSCHMASHEGGILELLMLASLPPCRRATLAVPHVNEVDASALLTELIPMKIHVCSPELVPLLCMAVQWQ